MDISQLMYELREATVSQVTAPVDEEKIKKIFDTYEQLIIDNIDELHDGIIADTKDNEYVDHYKP